MIARRFRCLQKEVVVKDAVPLFHSSTLSPLLETSATMVDAYATKKGLAIIGYYQVRGSDQDWHWRVRRAQLLSVTNQFQDDAHGTRFCEALIRDLCTGSQWHGHGAWYGTLSVELVPVRRSRQVYPTDSGCGSCCGLKFLDGSKDIK